MEVYCLRGKRWGILVPFLWAEMDQRVSDVATAAPWQFAWGHDVCPCIN